MQLNEDTVRSVVEHMNADHADACLLMVRAFTEHRRAQSAIMRTVDAHGLELDITCPSEPNDAIAQGTVRVRVEFPKPLSKESQLRGMLVGLTKQAREKLAEQQ